MDSNDRGILTLLAKGLRDLRSQVRNLSRQPGPSGKDGQDGQDGKDGLDGKDGIGLRGLAGADGADGARGPDGPQGVPGADGERGPMGPMPKHEWQGTKLRFQQTDSKWGKWTDLQGPVGKSGVAIGGGGGSGWSPSGLPAASNAQPPLRRELLYTAEKLSEVRIYQDGATLSEVRQLAYDGHGRLASITYRDGSMVVTHTRTLGYDGTDLLSAITDTTP